MQSIIIGKNQAGQRLDKFLHKYLPNAGTGLLYKMLRKKNITLNGRKADGRELLQSGDEIRCFFAEETFLKFTGQETKGGEGALCSKPLAAYHSLSSITVLYENEDILIVNKPAGILSQKAKAQDQSVNEWLIGYLLESGSIDSRDLATFKPSVCNRLDRNTSGIVLCGKTLSGSQYLSRIIKDRSIRKFYRTICVGELKEPKRIEGYLTKDAAANKVTVTAEMGGEHADYICTCYTPLMVKGGYTVLEVELVTGKPHQIRAHLAQIGHAVVGDAKYGNRDVNLLFRRRFGLQHQLLHAYRIVFPSGGGDKAAQDALEVTAPYPALFAEILQEMG